MENIGFGLEMTLIGMGTVFALLAVLMGLLMLIGRLDSPKPTVGSPAPAAVEAAPAPAAVAEAPGVAGVAIEDPSGLTEDQLAAIAIAVVTHAQVRRNQAAPEMRARQPGSQLHMNRWTTFGRSQQNLIHHPRRR